MSNFRYHKYIVGFAVCLVILVAFTACQKKEIEQVEGINVVCTEYQYSATSGKPMDLTHLICQYIPLLLSSGGEVNMALIDEQDNYWRLL